MRDEPGTVQTNRPSERITSSTQVSAVSLTLEGHRSLPKVRTLIIAGRRVLTRGQGVTFLKVKSHQRLVLIHFEKAAMTGMRQSGRGSSAMCT